MALVRSARFEVFCVQPRLSVFMEVSGGISYLHKRKIMRYTLPGTDQATPATTTWGTCAAGPTAS